MTKNENLAAIQSSGIDDFDKIDIFYRDSSPNVIIVNNLDLRVDGGWNMM